MRLSNQKVNRVEAGYFSSIGLKEALDNELLYSILLIASQLAQEEAAP